MFRLPANLVTSLPPPGNAPKYAAASVVPSVRRSRGVELGVGGGCRPNPLPPGGLAPLAPADPFCPDPRSGLPVARGRRACAADQLELAAFSAALEEPRLADAALALWQEARRRS